PATGRSQAVTRTPYSASDSDPEEMRTMASTAAATPASKACFSTDSGRYGMSTAALSFADRTFSSTVMVMDTSERLEPLVNLIDFPAAVVNLCVQGFVRARESGDQD